MNQLFIVRFVVGKDDECRAPCEMCRTFSRRTDADRWRGDLLWVCRQSDPKIVRQFNDAYRRADWFANSATPHPSNFGGRGWQVLSVGEVEVLTQCKEKPAP